MKENNQSESILMRDTFLGIDLKEFDLPHDIVIKLIIAWLPIGEYSFVLFKKTLKKIKSGELDQQDIQRITSKLREQSKYQSIEIIRSKLVDWRRDFPLSKKDWQELKSIFPLLEFDASLIIGTNPYSLAKELSEYVKGQYDGILALSLYLYQFEVYWSLLDEGCNALKPTSSRLIIGNTGTGKSYAVKTLASIMNVGYISVDCSRLVAEGYVGNKLYTEIRIQYEKLNAQFKDINRVIVFLDEFDKLVSDLSLRSSTLNEMLILLNDKTNTIQTPESYDKSAKISSLDISKFCFILGGAFTGIHRHNKISFGNKFDNSPEVTINLDQLVDYGIPEEIAGRIGDIIEFKDLTEIDLLEILTSAEESPLHYYEDFFTRHSAEFQLTEEELKQIVTLAKERNTGARGLHSILSSFASSRILKLFHN